VSAGRDPTGPRFNEKLDHLQAAHPFRYNLATGALIGVALLIVGLHPALVAGYALSWAAVRAWLWRDGHILRRQYEVRLVRVAKAGAAKRRQR
jgi:hypothetical protein